jgi:hypothetical protein
MFFEEGFTSKPTVTLLELSHRKLQAINPRYGYHSFFWTKERIQSIASIKKRTSKDFEARKLVEPDPNASGRTEDDSTLSKVNF